MRYFLLIYGSCLIFSCSGDSSKSGFRGFNGEAVDYFISNESDLDFTALDGVDECIVKKSILNDLDAMNSNKTVVIDDQFYIRNYYVEGLDFDFSSVKDSANNFYFFSLPQLHDYTFDVSSYYNEIDDFFILKDSIGVVDFSIGSLEMLTRKPVLAVRNEAEFGDKFHLLNDLMHEIFQPIFRQEISIGEFESRFTSEVGNIDENKRDYSKVRVLLNRISTSPNYVLRSCWLKEVGYILFAYSLDEKAEQIEVEAFLLPKIKRERILHSDVSTKYKECFSEE
jgi:hypothetical protein